MRFRRVDVSETAWKWRHKIASKFKRSDKTLADFSSGSISLEKPVDNARSHISRADGKGGEDGKGAIFGATAAVKTLYGRRASTDSMISWVDYPPKQMSKTAARAHDRVAIKVYKVNDADKPTVGGRVSLVYYRIDVQNPQLVAVLAEILKKEDDHLDVNETATFREPFRSLFFCYEDIVSHYRALPEGDSLKQHMLLLIKVMDEAFGDMRVKRNNLAASGLVSFKLAWTYFPRNCPIISWTNNTEVILRVVDTTVRFMAPAPALLVLRCKVLRFNGTNFIWDDTELVIPEFEAATSPSSSFRTTRCHSTRMRKPPRPSCASAGRRSWTTRV